MNGYDLSRQWFDYKFENNNVRSIHTELFFYVVDLWNRLGQKKEFGLPTKDTMLSLGIGSRNTYTKALNDIISFGFIKLITESPNQHVSKVIAISKIDSSKFKAHGRSVVNRVKEMDFAHSKSEQAPEQPSEQAKENNIQKSLSGISKSEQPSEQAPEQPSEHIDKPQTTNNKLYTIDKIPENKFSAFPPDDKSINSGGKKSKAIKEKVPPENKPVHPAYKPIVEFWLKDLHPDWTFGALHGIKVKSIIKKLEGYIKASGQEPTPEAVVQSFQAICNNLPDWYKNKDLAVIDSKLNEIITEIKSKRNGQSTTSSRHATGGRYSAAANYFDEQEAALRENYSDGQADDAREPADQFSEGG